MRFVGLVKRRFCSLLALLALAACSAPAPYSAGPIRIRWAHDPENLDPLQASSPGAVEAFNLLHCGLLQLDYARRKFSPALAEALPTVQLLGDSLTRLTYRLRPQATWDDGHPVLARDVAFSLKLFFCPGLPNEAAQAQYSFLREITLDPADPRRVTLLCRGQAPDYPQATGGFAVLPEATFDPAGQLQRFTLSTLRTQPRDSSADAGLRELARRYRAADVGHHPERLPGCGPYRLQAWVRDRHLYFVRKPAWWADVLPAPRPPVLLARPAALHYAIIPDETAAALALQGGELDLYPQLPAPVFARLRQSATAGRPVALLSAPSQEVVTAGFNTRQPALSDARTRQALSRLFDAEGLLRATQLGAGQRTVGIIPPADRLHYNDSLPLIPYDLPGAARLLRQAGWQRRPTGWVRGPGAAPPLHLRLRYRADESLFEIIALQFREAAGRLGIPVELRPTESAALSGVLRAGDFDLYLRTLKGNPFVFNFMPILHSRAVGEGNLTGFGTPASDHLIEAIAEADTPARQVRLLRRFQALLQAEAPLVPLFFLPNRLGASRQLAGLRVFSFKPGYVATDLHWANDSVAARQ